MIDNFALLGIERRPAVDENSLKQAYFRKSQVLHPDRDSENDFSTVNAAFKMLLNPASRIQHLLKLEFGDVAPGGIGVEFGELFGKIALLLRQADEQTVSVAAQHSPVLRAMAFQRLGPMLDDLAAIETELTKMREKLLVEIDALDKEWVVDPAGCRDSLVRIALNLSFIQKWSSEIRERTLKLEEIAG
jgi:curved DNA-binding protein CbpA